MITVNYHREICITAIRHVFLLRLQSNKLFSHDPATHLWLAVSLNSLPQSVFNKWPYCFGQLKPYLCNCVSSVQTFADDC